jgi:hypothetical protein
MATREALQIQITHLALGWSGLLVRGLGLAVQRLEEEVHQQHHLHQQPPQEEVAATGSNYSATHHITRKLAIPNFHGNEVGGAVGWVDPAEGATIDIPYLPPRMEGEG